jgi:hypothetical protein
MTHFDGNAVKIASEISFHSDNFWSFCFRSGNQPETTKGRGNQESRGRHDIKNRSTGKSREGERVPLQSVVMVDRNEVMVYILQVEQTVKREGLV